MKILTNGCRRFWDIFRNRYLSLLFRLALGGTLIISGVAKLSQGAGFVDEVQEFNLLPHALTVVFGTALPWVEVIAGVLLVGGLFWRYASAIAFITTLSFVIANSVVLYRGLNMECGCFGNLAQLHTRNSLIIDFVLLIMAFQVFVHKGDFFSLDSMISRRKSSETARD